MNMPPLGLMVLDALVDGHETVATMRDHGEVAPYGLALVDEADVIAALGVLLDEGLVEASEAFPEGLVLVAAPCRDPGSLGRYWFAPTQPGWQVWRDGNDLLDSYWAAHPI